MSYELKQDILRFFRIYDSRTADVLNAMPHDFKDRMNEEFDLLRASILNRLDEES